MWMHTNFSRLFDDAAAHAFYRLLLMQRVCNVAEIHDSNESISEDDISSEPVPTFDGGGKPLPTHRGRQITGEEKGPQEERSP